MASVLTAALYLGLMAKARRSLTVCWTSPWKPRCSTFRSRSRRRFRARRSMTGWRNRGRLLRDGAWETCTLFDINFRPEQFTPEELRRGFINLGERLYSHELTERRRANFEENYRLARAAAEEGAS